MMRRIVRMNDVTFQILKIVVSAAVTILTAVLIPFIRGKINDSKYAQLMEMIEIGVKAAEQTFKAQGKGLGKYKKDEVMSFVSAWMLEHGIKITEEQLSQLVEAAVFNMKLEKEKEV
jgi:LL-H family phage holin